MTDMHKHKGVERSNGTLRLHPVDRAHKDPQVKRWHNLALANEARKNKSTKKSTPKKVVKKVTKTKPIPRPTAKVESIQEIFSNKKEEGVMVPVEDNYLMIDLEKFSFKGVRVKFVRREGRTKRTVGLEINK